MKIVVTITHSLNNVLFLLKPMSVRTNILCFNQRKNDEPPRMTLWPLRVQLRSGVAISNSSLSLQDLDTPDNELIFVLTKKPDHGRTQAAMETS